MRWFKHLSNASEDEKLAELIEIHGAEGYGIYWMILEKIADKMSKGQTSTNCKYPASKWAKICGKNPRGMNKFYKTFAYLELMEISYIGNNSKHIDIDCHNLLKYRDEYTKKSGQTPDNDRRDSGETPDQETDTEAESETNTEEKKKERLLQSLKEGMIQTWQYLEISPELELKKDAIEVITSLREVRGSSLDPGEVEIATLIHNWLFGGVEKDVLLKMIKGASTDEFEIKNLTIEYILKPKHREKLLMKAEEIIQEKSKNFTEAKNIEEHHNLIKNEKKENEQYFLATVDQKLKIVLRAITGYGPYQSIIKEDSYREEIQKRITDYIKSNNTDRSTVMVGVNVLVTSYLEELVG